MENRSINYLISGPSHLPNLVASLYSLRRTGWGGLTYVHVWPESKPFVEKICSDPTLNCRMVGRSPEYRGKNSQFLDKIRMMQDGLTETVLYLDADTIVQGPLDELFTHAERLGFAATQFNDWVSNSGRPRRRIQRLIQRSPIDQSAVRAALEEPLPSVNGGVFACRSDSPLLETWYRWSFAVRDIFIADETSLHALYASHMNKTPSMAVMTGGEFNCSPKYKPSKLRDEQVKVWHFHGDCNLRPSKCQKGVDLWWPLYQDSLRRNLGGIADWKDQTENRFLRDLEATMLTAT